MKYLPDEYHFININFNIDKIINAYFYTNNLEKWTYRPISEDIYAINFITEGGFYFKINGKEHYTEKGDILFRDMSKEYIAWSKTPVHNYYAIRFTTSSKISPNIFHYITRSNKSDYYINLAKKAVECYENKSYGYILKIKSILYQVLNSILDEQAYANKTFKKSPLIAPSVLFLERNLYNKNLDIETIAKKSNISATHFRNIFKEIHGISPVKYIIDKRLERAAELLFYSNLNVNEIADQLGYNSTIYFDKIFKKKYGIPPGEYRRINKK